MHTITLRVYENGKNEFPEFRVPGLVTITGKEDHFRHAYGAAGNIVDGVRWAKPEAIVEVVKIELRG